jgi:tRNA 2-thiouridine synthesizing protein A
VWLDVRGLEPPEPLVRTLAALEELPEGHELVQINARVPQLLFPLLAERGFACEVDDSGADVRVRIWRAGAG